jgi:hypothetical protein
MKYVVYIILLSLTAGCAIKSTNESSSKNDESFEDFFKKFGSSEKFQASRIKFPLKLSYYDEYEEDSLTDSEIKAEDWKFVDFGKDSLASTKKEDAYNIEVIKNGLDAVEYLRKGIDNGISISYYFEKEKTKWFLVKIVDRSN